MKETAEFVTMLRSCLHPGDRVLLCYPLGACCMLEDVITEVAVSQGGHVVSWDGQRHWHGLLRQVFSHWVTVLIGDPRVILGIAKVARVTGTPLPVRDVVLLGQPCEEWMQKGIRDSLGATIYHCSQANTPCQEQYADPLVQQLDAQLLSWASILDYRVRRTEAGLYLEIIIFPGHQLPKLPSGANVTVRPWIPKSDTPFCLCEG